MASRNLRWVLIVALALGTSALRADELGTAIDLSALDQLVDASEARLDDSLLQEVGQRLGDAPRRFYLSGMIGPSFASVVSPTDPTLTSDDTLFNAGGAIGVAFARPRGALRWELEGMGRGSFDAPITGSPATDDYTLITNNWSAMTNLWRDLSITDRFGIYGGGGIGAGGYILGERIGTDVDYSTPAGAYAWQFGGGLLWDISERLTFDVGYRYFHIDPIRQAGNIQTNQFSASELMFTLRLYEPFRNWVN